MKRLMPTLLVVALIPQVAFAAWWNPLSWFDRSIPEVPDSPIEAPIIVETATTNEENKALIPTVEKETVETIVEKPVVRIVNVTDPALQARIDVLTKENILLKEQIRELQEQLNKFSEASVSPSPKSTYQSEVGPLVNLLESLRSEKDEIEEYLNSLNSISNCGSQNLRLSDGTYVYSCSNLKEKKSEVGLELKEVAEEEAEVLGKIELLKLRYGVE